MPPETDNHPAKRNRVDAPISQARSPSAAADSSIAVTVASLPVLLQSSSSKNATKVFQLRKRLAEREATASKFQDASFIPKSVRTPPVVHGSHAVTKTAEFIQTAQALQADFQVYAQKTKAHFAKFAGYEVKYLRDELASLTTSSIVYVVRGFLFRHGSDIPSHHLQYLLTTKLLSDFRFKILMPVDFNPLPTILEHLGCDIPAPTDLERANAKLNSAICDRALRTAISLFCAPYEAFVRCHNENRDVVEFNLLFEKMSADKATAVTQMDLKAKPLVSAPTLKALIAAAVDKRVEVRFKQLSQQKKHRGAGRPSTQTSPYHKSTGCCGSSSVVRAKVAK